MRLESFYNSKEWRSLVERLRFERETDLGLMCAYCGKPIVKKYDAIAHHVIFLTEENVNDFQISLNPENIQFVHHGCHNSIHNRRGWKRKEVFLVYGPPLAGKTTWVNMSKQPGDLVVDVDNLWQAVTGLPRYEKPEGLKGAVFTLRDTLYDTVRHRLGRWQCAYIVGGFPLISERERLIKEMGAREIFIDTSKEECLRRLEHDKERDQEQWEAFINKWFGRYRPPME